MLFCIDQHCFAFDRIFCRTKCTASVMSLRPDSISEPLHLKAVNPFSDGLVTIKVSFKNATIIIDVSSIRKIIRQPKLERSIVIIVRCIKSFGILNSRHFEENCMVSNFVLFSNQLELRSLVKTFEVIYKTTNWKEITHAKTFYTQDFSFSYVLSWL